MPKPRYWTGDAPTACDLTVSFPGPHDNMDTFVDGRTTSGPWANMCMACFTRYGRGLGMGSGQKYVKQEDGRWQKVEG